MLKNGLIITMYILIIGFILSASIIIYTTESVINITNYPYFKINNGWLLVIFVTISIICLNKITDKNTSIKKKSYLLFIQLVISTIDEYKKYAIQVTKKLQINEVQILDTIHVTLRQEITDDTIIETALNNIKTLEKYNMYTIQLLNDTHISVINNMLYTPSLLNVVILLALGTLLFEKYKSERTPLIFAYYRKEKENTFKDKIKDMESEDYTNVQQQLDKKPTHTHNVPKEDMPFIEYAEQTTKIIKNAYNKQIKIHKQFTLQNSKYKKIECELDYSLDVTDVEKVVDKINVPAFITINSIILLLCIVIYVYKIKCKNEEPISMPTKVFFEKTQIVKQTVKDLDIKLDNMHDWVELYKKRLRMIIDGASEGIDAILVVMGQQITKIFKIFKIFKKK